MKYCPRCEKKKLVSQFYAHHLTKDGFVHFCKACTKRKGPALDLTLKRLQGFPSMTKKQIGQALRGEVIDHNPRCYDDFVFPPPPSLMYSPPSCEEHREEYMEKAHLAFVEGGLKLPGLRPPLLWSLEYGIVRPSPEDQVLLIEAHSLWWPKEREALTAEIPSVAPCHLHTWGYPVDFPSEEEAIVKLIDGVLDIHPSCEACSKIFEWRGEEVN